MAHEIRSTDKFGEVRSNGQKAWHGLGVAVEAGLSAREGFRRIGLDWETELLPVFADRITPNGVERIEAKEHRLHVRADNGAVLGVVTDGYQKFDNAELADACDTILGLDAAASLETAGSLYDGRRVFALMKLPRVITAARGDEVNCYLAATLGHGGFASVAFYPTSVRIVCANTLRMSERDLGRGAKFHHTGDVKNKLATAKMLLGFADREMEKLETQIGVMARRMLTAEELRVFMNRAFDAAFPRPTKDDGTDTKDETTQKWLAKKTETFAAWRKIADAERNSMASIRGSLWAAFNTVTEWHDHERGRFTDVQTSDARVHSNLFGSSHHAKAKTLALALSFDHIR